MASDPRFLFMVGIYHFSFIKKKSFIYLFLAVLGLHFCVGFSLVAVRGGCSLVVVLGFLTGVVVSLIMEHGL